MRHKVNLLQTFDFTDRYNVSKIVLFYWAWGILGTQDLGDPGQGKSSVGGGAGRGPSPTPRRRSKMWKGRRDKGVPENRRVKAPGAPGKAWNVESFVQQNSLLPKTE